MKKIQDNFEQLKTWLRRPRTKKRLYVVLVVIVALWVMYRFAVIGAENRLQVFNPIRAASEIGYVVDIQTAEKQTGVLTEPMTVKNNRALVSGVRAHELRSGQRVGDGVIVSVSPNIDLDTGMHVVRTRGVADGLNFAQYQATGYFVPTSAIVNDTVYVVEDGIARARHVHVARSDAQTSVITDGLRDGDQVILSHIDDGAKVQIKK